MIKNADMPAMPMTAEPFPVGAVNTNYGPLMSGLTKREHFAGLAMQGILSNSIWAKEGDHLTAIVTKSAVEYADGLLAELEKPNEQN